VCGVHTIQAVEAGRTLGSALVASLHASAEFRKDLDAAIAEWAARGNKDDKPAASCATEQSTLSVDIYAASPER
jgi:acid phosphatase (class A)